MKIKEKKEQLAEFKKARLDLANSWEIEGATITEEDTQRFDALSADIDNLENEIKKLERIELSKANDAAEKKTVSFTYDRSFQVSDEDRENALRGWLIAGTNEPVPAKFSKAMEKCGYNPLDRSVMSFDQTVGTANQGGNLISGSVYSGIIDILKAPNSLMNLANVVTTADNTPIHFATNDDTANGLSLVTELGEVGNTSTTFGKVTLNSYDYASAVFPISRVLMQSSFPIVSYLTGLVGRRVARGIENVLTLADGSSKPMGLMNGLSAGKTCAADDAITIGDIFDLIESVDSYFYPDSVFMMNRATHHWLIENLLDQSDRPLLTDYATGWARAGLPTLLGFPVIYNSNVATIAADAKVAVFGSIRDAFTVRMVGNVRLAQSSELYWKSQAVALGAWVSFDSKVVNSTAAKTLVMGAA